MNELVFEIHTKFGNITMTKDPKSNTYTASNPQVDNAANHTQTRNLILDLILNDELNQALTSLHEELSETKFKRLARA